MGMQIALQFDVLTDHAAAAAVLEPTRLRILQALTEADSAAGVARRLRLARQRANYHLRELEKAGLVEEVEQRRKGNCVERIVRASARSYLIDPGLLGDLAAAPARVADRSGSTYLIAVASNALRELAELRRRAGASDKKLATLTIQAEVRFASAEDRDAFAEDLANLVAQLAREYHAPGGDESGRLFRIFVGGYPAIATQEREQGE